MKKRLIIMPVICLILIGIVAAIHVKSTPIASLAQSEIDKLRVKYPINDQQPETVDMIPLSLEEYIQICDCYVEVEVTSKPIECVKTVTIDSNTSEGALHEKAGGLTEFNFIKYEVRVIDDAMDNIQQDTIEVTYNSIFDIGMPSMDVGSRFIIGGVYNSKTGSIDIGSDTMFYITDDDYILSVKSEVSKNRHTGTKVEAFFEYLRTVKEETDIK